MNEGGALLQSLKFGKVDASGHYEITIDKPGDVVLVVSKDLGRGKGVDFYLTIPEVDQYTADLALPISAIRGTVRGPDGAPLTKFPVQLTRDSSGANIMMMDSPPSATTDDAGRYEFDDLNPGTYGVAAGGSSGAFDGDNTSYGRSVRGGLRIEKDRVLEGIDLKLSAPGRITGTVRDSNGAPVSGATVYVRDAQGELLSRHSACTSDASGKFVYKGVSPGGYTLSARTRSLAARDGVAVQVHEGETTETDLAMEAGTILRVSAVDKDDKPLKAGISVKDERGFEVSGMQTDDAMQEAFVQGISSTEQKIGPLPAGKYVVSATAPDGTSAKKPVTLKGQDERKLVVRVE
jgi:protocatechuate 3,4-dioxygenase beta subunit